MYVCPLCNGLEQLEKTCPNCNGNMYDIGRVVDYYDDYSPYWEDEDAKMVDGLVQSKENHLCLHAFHCPACQIESRVTVREEQR
ncbi:hypothetical protein [Salirhabdus salicampi]|uniref:hypothetical protein n=1 Tax=Salirhabdus salicampi TaxID=476102 RepID=UPI0020C45153|nr:hypothetical protein [Salirhabdus salicampi]MCP8615486.1 hypothetical protein [Salirhabdus salicampi]